MLRRSNRVYCVRLTAKELATKTEVPERFKCPSCPYLEAVYLLRKKIFPLFTTRSGNPNYGSVASQPGEVYHSSLKHVCTRYERMPQQHDL